MSGRVQVTVYGGAGQVGGNKILLEDGKDLALFLDFGTDFKMMATYYEEYLKPRDPYGLLDYLEMDILPPLGNIYREDLLQGDIGEEAIRRMKKKPGYRSLERLDGVLASHAHMDHVGAISFLKDIPVAATSATAIIAKAVQDIGQAGRLSREICYCSPRTLQGDLFRSDRTESAWQRRWDFLDGGGRPPPEFWNRSPWEKKNVMSTGDANGRGLPEAARKRVRFFPVDHSIPGACGFAVETSAGWIVYTGDIRMHGQGARNSRKFLEEAKKLEPALLICEGTEAGGSGRRRTEADVGQACLREVLKSKGRLVIADFQPRHIERLQTFLAIARQAGRKLVILPQDAYLLYGMRQVDSSLPDPASDEHIAVYFPAKAKAGEGWEQFTTSLIPGEKRIGPGRVRDEPGEWILCMSYFDLKEFPSIEPYGSRYIWSTSEAYDEEARGDLERLKHWLAHFRIEALGLPSRRDEAGGLRFSDESEVFHAHGHLSAPELEEMVETVGPRKILPVHTEHPEWFSRRWKDRAVVPQKGEPILL